MNSSVFVAAFHKTLGRIRHPLRTHSFVLLAKSAATYCAAAKRQRRLCLCSECVEVWVVMQIANCAGHRGKSEGNGSLPARRAEGGTNWCEPLPPFFLSLSLLLSPFHSLYPKLAAGRQMNAVWSEPTEVQGPAVQATKELHARHLLFSYQNTFSHVPAFPSLSPHSSSTTAPQHPFHQLRPSLFLSPHFSSTTFFSRMLLKCLLCWHPPTIPMNIHSFATIILLPTSSLARCPYLNSVGLADNPTVLPSCSKMH